MKKICFLFFLILLYFNCFSQNIGKPDSDKNPSRNQMENIKSLFLVYISDDCSIGLSEPISSVLKKIGEPNQITEEKENKDLQDEYATVTIHYPDFDISYWKGVQKVKAIKIKTDKVYVSERKVKIGKTTISEILDLYRNLEIHNYFLSEDKNENLVIYLRFSTINHLFMPENADKDSFYHITYIFDYKKKLCVGMSMEMTANGW